ncbi:nitrilase-related carbon-nitrogen hydrolase [Chitinophaga rhizophila]|uniref:CN hydrolase domain-containing protein n=1 Tax=Chitinophaga rhizophila TaxID=2866212 RepID=A0ABS7G6M1_9BACT|nr:nitrilase-related carbon-nitrogen hydrolase [Chitinophaga rhizophila]MBW8683299.1 hypothetical protein [Chitinophaga rhizophila]
MPFSQPMHKTLMTIGLLFSAVCWYLTFSLSGAYWYLLWLAPIPVLYYSFLLKRKWAFLIAFTAYLIGRLSWWAYLQSLMPLPLAVIFTLLFPVIFALIVLGTRAIVGRYRHWSAAFAFPVLTTTFEYVMGLFSQDGTAGSIAYTQSNFLPVVQIASVTGFTGITFLVTLVPSAVAVMLYNHKRQAAVKPIAWMTISMTGIALFFGMWRLHDTPAIQQPPVRIGMVTIDERAYYDKYATRVDKQAHLSHLYLKQVASLAHDGAEIIVFPEKMFRFTDSIGPDMLQVVKDTARTYRVMIVACVDQNRTGFYENRAWVISPEGELLADYQKGHLFAGEIRDSVKPAQGLALFTRTGSREGVAICKDMDFPQFIAGYGKAASNLLYVPAWDFVRDGWLHSRMAMMRSVEGGYSLVRNAREGRLTINDCHGKIAFEASSESGAPVRLLGSVVPAHHQTLYNVLGDWFGILNVAAAAAWLIALLLKKRSAALGERI